MCTLHIHAVQIAHTGNVYRAGELQVELNILNAVVTMQINELTDTLIWADSH